LCISNHTELIVPSVWKGVWSLHHIWGNNRQIINAE